MRASPSSLRLPLQAAALPPRTILRHGSRISLMVMSLMLAFPGTSHAGGAAGGNALLAVTGTGGGAGAGYDGAGNITFVGASNVTSTAAGGSAGGGAGGTSSAGGGGGGIGSTQSSPGGLTSAVTGGAGGAGSASGGGGGGDGAVLGSGGTVNVAVTGGAGGASTASLSGGAGGGAGIVYTAANASLMIVNGVTGGGGGGGLTRGGGGGGSGVWVTSSGDVNVTTGIVKGGNGGSAATGYADGGGGAGVVFSATGGQLEVGGQVRGGVASGTGTGGAGVNIISGGVTVTVDSGAVIAGGAGGGASELLALSVLSGLGGTGSGSATAANRNAQTGTGGVGIVAAGGNNTIVTSGAINGATGLAGQANAITFSGNNNTLELQAGYSFTGNVVNTAGATGNTLVLGGATNASFDISSLRPSASASISTTQYVGFNTLKKTGTSTWTLTGHSFFLGDTIVAQGTLQAGNATAFSAGSAMSVASNATLDLNNFDQTVGSLSGAGNVTLGAATLTVGLDNSNGNSTFDGVISGTGGGLTKGANGTLILTGANSYSGNTTITGGILQVGAGGTTGSLGTGAVIDNAALVFDRSDAPTVANVISGSGSVTQNGGGNLILTGANLYAGPTVINSGTLSVNGSIVSDTTINNGGTLGGNGTVGNVNVASGGVLAPDNSSGMLHVNGNLTFNAGATYRVQVDAAGNGDRTDVTGNAALAGTVDVQAGAGNYAANTSYTILSDTGTQSGAFSGVTSNLAFLTPTLSYQPNAVMLNLARNNISFADVAATNNQRGVANALQNATTGATGDIGTVVNAVTNLSADQARAAFDAMDGASLTSMRRANLSFVNGFDNQVRARLNVVGASADGQQAAFDTPVLLAANDQVSDLMPMLAQQSFSLDGAAPSAAPVSNRGLWLRGYGSDQSTAGDANAAGSRQKDAGISAGFDARVNDNWVVGVALTHDHADVYAANQNGNSNGNAVALYGSYASGPWNVNGVFSYAHNSNGTQRHIAFGSIDRTAMANFGSRTVSLYGDVTYDVPLAGWTLQPLAGLSLSSNRAAGYSETGAAALDLQIASQTVQSTKSLFGAKALINVSKVQLQPRLIWSHEFSNVDDAAMTAQLQGAPTPFAINGVDVPRDSLIAGLTVSGQASERMAVFADVQEELNSSQNKLGLLLGLRASW